MPIGEYPITEHIINRSRDKADMDRAVALSDAYYGDQSSVLQVYKKTGKSIMLQDVHAVN